MNGVYLIIGGNMGKREQYLAGSVVEIEKEIGVVIKKSFLYETASWGNTAQNSFLNQALYLKTNLTARETLNACLAIEKKMGRTREVKWGERIIDIDIIFFNDEVIHEDNLKIPHLYMQHRKFVLVPLNEIAPDLLHPVLQKTVHELLLECEDELEVEKF